MVCPVGVYLMRVFIQGSVPPELMDAARIDGASEPRIFFRIALLLMVPGLVTVLLISVVAVWNNYFFPLTIFSKASLNPLTVGIGNWASRAQAAGATPIFPLVVVGARDLGPARDLVPRDPALLATWSALGSVTG